MFALTMMNGMCMAFPDVCLTPTPVGPIPIPYPNMSMGEMADPATCADTVNVLGMPALMQESQIMLSQGDDGGVNGGIMSGIFIGPTEFLLGADDVIFEGGPALPMGATMTGQNGEGMPNIEGDYIVPSQTVVMALG
ncbi:DUF4150 domain-containing protein [Desulfovibrio inopinatus]|uniref:DUF4150 domain-containing protein n=1 Tax=Desulfovibrio inopinatus TaxID=102109 RepID=UPI00041D4B82|nr:DUF4150 domain-containing protein [Desulfovibrio inopinatus]